MTLCRLAVIGAALIGVLCGCEREPLERVCPTLAPGSLVVSEVRGDPDGTHGQWIELYNASAEAVDLRGLEVVFTERDNQPQCVEPGNPDTRRFVVRSAALVVDAGEYVVLGRFEAGNEPDHVDYGFLLDHGTSNLFDSATVELLGCDDAVDVAVYCDLPPDGTFALSGDATPTPQANDDGSVWCVDDVTESSIPNSVGLPGTPGQPNAVCSP